MLSCYHDSMIEYIEELSICTSEFIMSEYKKTALKLVVILLVVIRVKRLRAMDTGRCDLKHTELNQKRMNLSLEICDGIVVVLFDSKETRETSITLCLIGIIFFCEIYRLLLTWVGIRFVFTGENDESCIILCLST